ncbi:hypothetical protein ACXDBF_003065 [Cronobacter sakazakii]
MNNDELIAAGHELAKCIDSNTPLLDIAKLLSKMATQLGVTAAALREKTKQCDALAAEVYDVKHPGTYLPSKCETPATDAFIAEQRAQGVEMFSEQQRSYIGKPSKNDAASSYCSREAIQFAAQLRQGGAA